MPKEANKTLRWQPANPVLSPNARTLLRRFLALWLSGTFLSGMTAPALGQTAAAPTGNPGFTIRARTELVVVNVTARDRNGNMVKDLKAEDFTVLEENKPQQIASFDIESTDAVALPEAAQVQLLKTAPAETGSGGKRWPRDQVERQPKGRDDRAMHRHA